MKSIAMCLSGLFPKSLPNVMGMGLPLMHPLRSWPVWLFPEKAAAEGES